MAAIYYHASHEQFSPSSLLKYSIMAENAGFQGIHSSDHFHPWSERQGQSGFSFTWIGAAMQATKLPFSMVCAPGQRYHPAIVAQAIATIAEMFPRRINIELGSGEALNELITGDEWPDKSIRNQRLLESANIIRQLLHGEEVTFDGLVKVKKAKLYTIPENQPLLLCAALSEETSKWAGSWADGLLTTAGDLDDINKKISAFNENGGTGKPVYLQFAFSYARTKQKAASEAWHQWRSNIVPVEDSETWSSIEQFDKAGEKKSVEDVTDTIPVFTEMRVLNEQIRKLESTGACRIILHNVGRNQEEFITDAQLMLKNRYALTHL